MLGDRLDISRAGDIRPKEADAAGLRLRSEFGRGALENVEATSKDQYVGPVTSNRPRRRPTDPGPTTRHDHDCSHDFSSRTSVMVGKIQLVGVRYGRVVRWEELVEYGRHVAFIAERATNGKN
jgi:hypothetical protein